MKARLAERLASVEERARQQGDYMSKEEAVGMDEIRERKRKKKSKKERRLRKKDHDEGEEGATDALIAQARRGGGTGVRDGWNETRGVRGCGRGLGDGRRYV